MRVVVIADTHSLFSKIFDSTLKEQAKDADLVLLLGDHSIGDIRNINNAFESIKKFGVLGNHDTEYTFYNSSIENIHNKGVLINDVTIVGMQGSSKYKEKQIGYTQDESIKVCHDLPNGDILICHDAPFGFEGSQDDIAHCGLLGILSYINTKKPNIVFYGHHHHNKWYKIDNTHCICVYGVRIFDIDTVTKEVYNAF